VKWRKKAGGGKQPYQGHFYPGYPEKYEGKIDTIMFRSGLELRLFKYLDEAPGIIRWSSEETVIKYRSPVDGKIHRYFVDAKITTKKDEIETTYLIEVKPASQCKPPSPPKKPNKKSQARFLRESRTYKVNLAKWNQAELVCEQKGWTFLKLTEKDLSFGRV
jgi:hypothetical protein